jgi:acyl-lipid omega-6 desaturase (Delta-12 desaturase)
MSSESDGRVAGNNGSSSSPESLNWKRVVAPYQQADTRRAVGQVLNTFLPYLGLWVVMAWLARYSLWLALPVAVVAGAFLVRIFIIFHDCGHGSFFKSRRANHVLGTVAGLFCFASFYHWRWEHSVHHASAGDLDRRGTGDVWTMTVEEYLKASRWKRFAYRLARNPVVLFLIAPLLLFLVLERFPGRKAGVRERWSVYATNVGLLAMVLAGGWVMGFKTYMVLQLVAMAVAGSAGVWLFYVQHQFEGVYWERKESWDYAKAALEGSSYYKLPKVLQWFSGNIGFHHIHHLSPRIPNYNLERCHHAEPLFRDIKPITLRSSLKSIRFRLWDEASRQMVGYPSRAARRLLAQGNAGVWLKSGGKAV